jgi:hypothetical protein
MLSSSGDAAYFELDTVPTSGNPSRSFVARLEGRLGRLNFTAAGSGRTGVLYATAVTLLTLLGRSVRA